MTDVISENTWEDKQCSGGGCERKNKGRLGGGNQATQSRRACRRACCTAPRTRGGFDGETELIIAPEAPKAQSWLRGWGLEWMEEWRGGAGNVLGDTHTLTEDGKLLIAMKRLC